MFNLFYAADHVIAIKIPNKTIKKQFCYEKAAESKVISPLRQECMFSLPYISFLHIYKHSLNKYLQPFPYFVAIILVIFNTVGIP